MLAVVAFVVAVIWWVSLVLFEGSEDVVVQLRLDFTKVLSTIGSFVNLRGGNAYPSLIRKTEKKPLRVFLQDGENDLDNANGNWPLANQTLAKSLAFAGYDYKFELGHGFHSNRHGRAILPDSLRWLWRDYRTN